MIETFIGKFNDVTVFTKQDIVFRNTHQNTEFGVSDEVSVLAVNWNEEFGLDDRQISLQFVSLSVSGCMNIGDSRVHDFSAKAQ